MSDLRGANPHPVWARLSTPGVDISTQTAEQYGVGTLDQFLAAGMTPRQVEWALRTGALERVHRGVYGVAGAPSSQGRSLVAACLAAGHEAMASHRSALWLWGMTRHPPEEPEIVVPRRSSPQLHGVIVHRCRDLDRTTHNLRLGVPVTNPLRSLVDAGAVLPEEDVKEALLTATGARLITVMGAKAELDRVGRPGRRGAGVLRAILTELGIEGSRAPSVLEAKMRSLINRLDLPENPVCELVAGENGEYRLDFPFPAVLLDVEVDGWEVHSSDDARRTDLTRQNRLSALGWAFLRYTWHDVVRRPAQVGAEIRAVYYARLSGLGPQTHV
ncbi:MAG: hypothetical protein QOE35_3165 [Actinomycetota bacterium]|jgi:hypothetical protein